MDVEKTINEMTEKEAMEAYRRLLNELTLENVILGLVEEMSDDDLREISMQILPDEEEPEGE